MPGKPKLYFNVGRFAHPQENVEHRQFSALLASPNPEAFAEERDRKVTTNYQRERRQTTEGGWERICTCCGDWLPEDPFFFARTRHPQGHFLAWVCKDCCNERQFSKPNHKEKALQGRKTRVEREKQNGGTFTAQDERDLWQAQRGKCFYCKNPLDRYGFNKYHLDHKTPVSRGGASSLENMCLACPRCNNRKSTKTAQEFVTRR